MVPSENQSAVGSSSKRSGVADRACSSKHYDLLNQPLAVELGHSEQGWGTAALSSRAVKAINICCLALAFDEGKMVQLAVLAAGKPGQGGPGRPEANGPEPPARLSGARGWPGVGIGPRYHTGPYPPGPVRRSPRTTHGTGHLQLAGSWQNCSWILPAESGLWFWFWLLSKGAAKATAQKPKSTTHNGTTSATNHYRKWPPGVTFLPRYLLQCNTSGQGPAQGAW